MPSLAQSPPAPRLEGYEAALGRLASADERIVVMTAENRAAIRGLPDVLGARFVDVGICEQTLIGMAAGLASRGRIPVAHALATFLTLRAFEFIRTDVGIARLPVKLVGGVPGVLSEANGPTHQAIEDVALMRGIPGMQIVCPADEEELAAALPAILASPAPCYVRYVGGPAAFARPRPFALGQALRLREGGDVALLSYGYLSRHALAAAEELGRAGVSARVVHFATLAPVDRDELLAAARDARLVVTVEDHLRVGGLYSILAEALLDARVTARVLPLALDGRWFRPALLSDVLRVEGFDGPSIARRVLHGLAGETAAPPRA